MLPVARHDKFLIQEVGDELVIYDLERDWAHRLNRSTALIWRGCDGQTSIAELATLLEMELRIPVDERVVWLALKRLGKAQLLRAWPTPPAEVVAISRREAMALGLAGAMSLVLHGCDSVIAPTPDHVFSEVSLEQAAGACREKKCGAATVVGRTVTCAQGACPPPCRCVPKFRTDREGNVIAGSAECLCFVERQGTDANCQGACDPPQIVNGVATCPQGNCRGRTVDFCACNATPIRLKPGSETVVGIECSCKKR
jgi:hypothetical protein